jgi:hypothetical protein
MLEVGKTYTVRRSEDGAEGTSVWTVAEVKWPLVRLTNPHTADRIVNIGSANFISAELNPHGPFTVTVA